VSVAVRITTTRGSVLEALSALALERDDKTELLEQIGINMVENTRLRFGDQVAPDGTPWEPSLRALNEGGDTLRDKGVLLNSITSHVVGGDGVEWGTNVPYALPLHFGATIQAVNGPYLKFKVPGGWAQKAEVTIPARPFLGMDSEDEQLVVDIIGAFMATLGNRK
jgi:phage gpG-like protein